VRVLDKGVVLATYDERFLFVPKEQVSEMKLSQPPSALTVGWHWLHKELGLVDKRP
jgi:hypothetical protein